MPNRKKDEDEEKKDAVTVKPGLREFATTVSFRCNQLLDPDRGEDTFPINGAVQAFPPVVKVNN